MGRGSKPSENKVKKERQQYNQTQQGGGAGGNTDNDNVDSCLFSFSDEISLTSNLGNRISQTMPVVLVPDPTGQRVDMYINGKNVGAYNGNFAQKVLECAKKRYIYEGIVDKVENISGQTVIQYSIQAKGA